MYLTTMEEMTTMMTQCTIEKHQQIVSLNVCTSLLFLYLCCLFVVIDVVDGNLVMTHPVAWYDW